MEPDSRMSRIFGSLELMVNSGHHQAIQDVAEGFKPAGRSSDGIIEAMEYTKAPMVMGVQWHAEGLAARDPAQLALFEALVDACARD
jgi:putative glutamine amidotransferase